MKIFEQISAKPVMQLALDVARIDEAVRLADLVVPCVEILEVGTPLIIAEGVRAVRALKSRYPGKVVLADLKIADAGNYEAKIAFDAGADLVTVLGTADPRTIEGAVESARECDGGIVIDAINMKDPAAAAGQFVRLDAVCIELHVGTGQDYGAGELAAQVRDLASKVEIPVAVAGGLTPESVQPLLAAGTTVFVVGSFITRAIDPVKAAREFNEALRRSVN